MLINRLITSVYVSVNGLVFNKFSMFDELKEVKYFKEITDFKSLMISNTLKAQRQIWDILQGVSSRGV